MVEYYDVDMRVMHKADPLGQHYIMKKLSGKVARGDKMDIDAKTRFTGLVSGLVSEQKEEEAQQPGDLYPCTSNICFDSVGKQDGEGGPHATGAAAASAAVVFDNEMILQVL